MFITEILKQPYANLISTANRANVSFYTVDPKGLVTWDQEGAGRDYLSGAAGETRSQQMRGGTGEVSTMQARAAETAEGALRANPLLWLRDLAQQTGGATIAETNDWRAPLRAVDRKSTRLNSSHRTRSYAVFCWKKKTTTRSWRPTRR